MLTVTLPEFIESLYSTALWLSFMWFWLAFCVACGSRVTSRGGRWAWSIAALSLPILGVAAFVWFSGYGWFALALLAGGFISFVALIAGELMPEAEDKVVTWPLLVKFKEIVNLPVDQLRRLVGRYAGTTLVVLFLTCCLAFFLGRYEARHKKEYLVVEGIPRFVVMRTYPGRVICASYRRNHKEKTITIGENILVLEAGELSGRKMRWTKRHDLP